ncbi:hypothetical protein LTR27_013024 [Elasticomyces elasticus]|nr:hypothetical protein LTR27_013024 [Elasticomyces elasticus]
MADITTATNIDKVVDTTTQSNSTMVDTASDLNNGVTVDEAEVPPSTTAWLDRLPTEVRIEIFKIAQKHKGVLLVVDERNKDAIVDVSLLVALVNNKKSIEAVEGFFTANTFRLTKYVELESSDLGLAEGAGDAFKYITYLELRNLANSDEFMSEGGLQLATRVCAAMPRLKEVTVAFDRLASEVSDTFAEKPILRTYLAALGYDGLDGWKLECVGIGQYTLAKQKGLTITFVHVGLVGAWAEMKGQKPETWKGQVRALAKALKTEPRTIPGLHGFFHNISLAGWSVVFERCIQFTVGGELENGIELSSQELDLLEMAAECQKNSKATASRKVTGRVTLGHVLRDFDEEEVRFIPDPKFSVKSAEVMEALTELLRNNNGRSPRIAAGGQGVEYWRERAGNMGETLEIYEDGEGEVDGDAGEEESGELGSGEWESEDEEGNAGLAEGVDEN